MKHIKDIEQQFWSMIGQQRPPAKRQLVPVYRVGEVFHRGRRTWPEGGQFALSPGGLELTLFSSEISREVVHEVRQGEVELALIAELPLIVLAFRFGEAVPWSDVPYSWHLQPASWRVVPSVERAPESRALLWITLVGAGDGIIHAQRGVTLSPNFTYSLRHAIRAQAFMPFDPDGCTTAISKVFLEYPKTVDRLALAPSSHFWE